MIGRSSKSITTKGLGVESVNSILKRVFGNHLSLRRRRSQRNEHHLRVISYNIRIANRILIKAMLKQLSYPNRKL